MGPGPHQAATLLRFLPDLRPESISQTSGCNIRVSSPSTSSRKTRATKHIENHRDTRAIAGPQTSCYALQRSLTLCVWSKPLSDWDTTPAPPSPYDNLRYHLGLRHTCPQKSYIRNARNRFTVTLQSGPALGSVLPYCMQ